LDELLLREEIMWKKRSRIEWLRDGDRNTRFFHRKASGRRKRNKIVKLRRNDGSFATDEEEIKRRTQLFLSPSIQKTRRLSNLPLESVEAVVTDLINSQLVDEFTEEKNQRCTVLDWTAQSTRP
jgi:hypothetical protein